MTEQEARDYLIRRGWGVEPPDRYRIDMEPEFLEIWEKVKDLTMTSLERGYALYRAVRHLSENQIPGEFVECGVWKGGSCLLIALTLLCLGDTGRTIRLYDTFRGMTEPTGEDVIAWNNLPVLEKLRRDREAGKETFAGWAVSQEEVRSSLESSGYPPERFHLVEGDVTLTLKENRPEQAALLRLDTDWYASTLAELEELYPRLVPGGILILDDYGHFRGARKAADEYFSRQGAGSGGTGIPFLHRIDYTGRLLIKPRPTAGF